MAYLLVFVFWSPLPIAGRPHDHSDTARCGHGGSAPSARRLGSTNLHSRAQDSLAAPNTVAHSWLQQQPPALQDAAAAAHPIALEPVERELLRA